MPRQTDEELYTQIYIDHLKAIPEPNALVDRTPSEYPGVTSKLPEFSISTLYINRHLKLSPYAKEALFVKTGFTFTTKVILLEKAYYPHSKAIRNLTISNVLLRSHGGFSACISDVKGLFDTIRKLHHRELSTFTTYKEPKKSKRSSGKSETNTSKKDYQLSVDEILERF